ncbi:MAG: hypothetical protein ABI658_18920 [Acidimicrobiales bacterium]
MVAVLGSRTRASSLRWPVLDAAQRLSLELARWRYQRESDDARKKRQRATKR